MDQPVVIRPSFGRLLTVIVSAIAVLVLVSTVVGGRADLLPTAVWAPLMLAYASWLVFWNPRVRIATEGVEIRNVFRTHDISWPAIRRVDTKWALNITTAHERVTAWAAPAPGRHSNAYITTKEERNQPYLSAMMQDARRGDLPRTDSGDAATVIRLRLADLAEAGHLGGPVEEEARRVRTHWVEIAVLAVLVVATVASSLV
ncbi:PH domain-containing protein [Clavibacter michiganensis]|uniref:Low molecular weight protein antigen 6 PH domain-containing protein n=1 Tax=Clavibacter michiganensis TaxID=28447 RepID=A0A251XVX8_9MICO|nr:PH domain-containing protein [Clavibacter michiganensis]OUE09722.1 hypothetical protein CMsap09_12310 [Clavibacter michiganensis]PPF52700.1 PH domain-containing protein [Clavibacter michiganensis]